MDFALLMTEVILYGYKMIKTVVTYLVYSYQLYL